MACASLFDGTDSTAVCGTAVEYSSNTTFKSYTCDLEGTGLETTIVPGTFYVTCNTTSPGAEVTVADLIAHWRIHLAGFNTPKRVDFTLLPKTSTGKIQKFELRAQAKGL